MCIPKSRNKIGRQAKNVSKKAPRESLSCEEVSVEVPVVYVPPPPPPRYRLRVRVCYFQHRNTVVPGATARVDGNGGGPPGGDGYADFGQVDPGDYVVTVARSGDDPPGFIPRADHDLDLQDDTDLTVYVDQVVRVRLGHRTDLPRTETAEGTWFRFYLPRIVGSGGAGKGHCMDLSVRKSAGTVMFHGTSPYDPGDENDGWTALATGAAGYRYCQIPDAAAARVTPRLQEEGASRDGQAYDSGPFVPWSFYFWSACRAMPQNAGTPVAFLPSAHVDNASRYSPFETFDAHFGLGTASFDWESDPAHDTHNDSGLDHACPSWVGHCNMMGAAAVVFDTPVDQDPFDFEELKLFAAEFAGNHTASTNVWALADHEVAQNHPARPIRKVVPSNLTPQLNEAAWRAEQKREVREALGPAAVQLLAALRQHLGGQGEPLLCDMRAAYDAQNVQGSSAEVWNQAVFLYRAYYAEHESATAAHGGEVRQGQDLQVAIEIYANSDGVLPPATPLRRSSAASSSPRRTRGAGAAPCAFSS
jgi:hypothetical protein